ncbi:CocE/NonD family hydrolase [Brevibacterium sp. 239c]|uniref:CocE/NonD family hydrolase n=1 Tax=Brevibacterium sp. 239c TaxID=1965356 RepID=UPI000C78CCEC|nr:CocE/NonD family hydrolase [Brevibacterium sp. 239c]
MTEDLPVPCIAFQVQMRDGITLATDVYGIPDDDRALPVVLERTPYGRRSIRTSDAIALNTPVPLPEATAARFVASGFILVRQDTRGRGDSGGVFEKYVNESDDGEDTLGWLSSQPWCDGRVGMMGVSYSAHVQTAVAARGPEALMAMILDSGGFTSAFEAGIRYGGAFELKQATWAVRHALKSVERRSEQQRAELEAVDVRAWFDRMPNDPWRPGHSPVAAAPEYESALFDQWRRDVLDDGWRSEAVYTRDSGDRFPTVPTMAIGSWYDPYVRSMIELFQQQSTRGADARLIMGPWLHGMRTQTRSGDVEFGPVAAWDQAFNQDYTHSRIAWMHAAAKGTRNDKPAVTAFVMGGGSGGRNAEGRLLHGGQWHRWTAWPPATAQRISLMLGADGTLTRETRAKGSVELVADPVAPVPTLGGQVTSGAPVMTGGGFDQSEIGEREDVLVYRSTPLDEAVTVAGRVRLHIVLVASTPDLDVSVKLIDEHPPSQEWPHGFALNVCDGILRARYRRGYEEKVPLDIGEETELVVDLPDTANLFAAGHRIRVDIAGSNFPHFDINPNHGGPPWELPHLFARSTVVLDGRTRLEIDTVPCSDGLPVGYPLDAASSAVDVETSAS